MLPIAFILAAHAEEVLVIDPTGGLGTVDLRLALAGSFAAVDVWDSSVSNPTLADLAPYEGVLLTSSPDLWHLDSAPLGEAVADYVDAGGTVVETAMNGYWLRYGYSLGRFDNYMALGGGNSHLSFQTLSWSLPGHPFSVGVNTTYIPRYALFDGVVVPGATLVAQWAAGPPAVATWTPTGAGVVTSVGFLPRGLTASPDGIDYSQTDEDTLFANTLTGGGVGFLGFTSGTCPGQATLTAVNGTPLGGLAVVSGTGPGSFTVPGGACAGTTLPITGAQLRLLTSFDTFGDWTLTRAFNNPAVCGKPVVLLDLSTCAVAQTALP